MDEGRDLFIMLMLKNLWSRSRWMFSGHGNDVGADSSISRGLHVHTGLQEKKTHSHFLCFSNSFKRILSSGNDRCNRLNEEFVLILWFQNE